MGVLPTYMLVYYMHARCLRRPEDGANPLKLESFLVLFGLVSGLWSVGARKMAEWLRVRAAGLLEDWIWFLALDGSQ